MMEPLDLRRLLVDAAAERYSTAGRFAYHFARGKLAGDPVFGALLARGLVPDAARILDLGCGQGLLAAWLMAAEESHRAGDWCAGWPPPPTVWSFRGIELMPRDVARAREALTEIGEVEVGDVRTADLGAADLIVILDVLHYMDPASQEALLGRVRAALSPAGVLLLRIGDASGGLPFRISNWVDQAVLLVRGHGLVRLHCRSLEEWIGLLERLGFRADTIPMSENTPFANVLLVARS
jgi:SAM-dependent methyltransferase